MKYLATALLLTVSMTASAATYEIDNTHSYVIFKTSHLGISYIVGHIEEIEGTFTHDAENPSASGAKVTMQVDSLDSDLAERDKHLKGPEFLDAAAHPEITFVSTGFNGSASEGTLSGDVTIRGVKKGVDIAVQQVGEGNDPWGGYRSGFVGNASLNAEDFGLPGWVGTVELELILEGICCVQ